MRRLAVALALVVSVTVTGGAAAAPSVLGGSAVAAGALPFVVGISYQTSNASYLCTGTVIAPNAVLTANHCAFDEDTGRVVPPSAFTVYTKTTDLNTPDQGAEQRSVSAVHASYTGDVAVLILSTPTTIAPVRLATTSDAYLYAERAPAVVAGWGATAYGGQPGNELVQATEAVRATWECVARSRQFVPAYAFCATLPGARGVLCNGDSGGPLLASTPAGWIEIGVTSTSGGLFCGTGFDFFARVATLQPWIASEAAGTPPPKLEPPPLEAPSSVTLRRSRNHLVVTFHPASVDPATVFETFSVFVRNASGHVVRSKQDTLVHSLTFSLPPSGIYRATVTANYLSGKSTGTVSPPVTIRA